MGPYSTEARTLHSSFPLLEVTLRSAVNRHAGRSMNCPLRVQSVATSMGSLQLALRVLIVQLIGVDYSRGNHNKKTAITTATLPDSCFSHNLRAAEGGVPGS